VIFARKSAELALEFEAKTLISLATVLANYCAASQFDKVVTPFQDKPFPVNPPFPSGLFSLFPLAFFFTR
jgi:hypothetical protein